MCVVSNMAGAWIRPMMVVLCFSYLICTSSAIPVTTGGTNLEQKPQSYEVAKEVILEYSDQKAQITNRRMVIELNDYPGSGANNRHTPKPREPGRSCIDC